MSDINRRHYSAEEKVQILKAHLLEGKPVSEVCNQYGIQPGIFYRWQQEFFEHGHLAFGRRDDKGSVRVERKVQNLEEKLVRKNEVLAELMEEHVALKKSLGET